MKKLILAFALILPGIAIMSANLTSTEVDDLTQLKTLNARFIHNFVTNDVPSHDQIIHANFVCINTKGKWINRQDYLDGWKTGFDPAVYLYWDYRFEKITIIGSTALVRAVTKYTTLRDGKETTGMTQYTDTYVKENGTWKCIQAQLTSVAPENYPGDETIVKKYINGKIQ
jgi:hypothetical protein